jgi:flagellum-specific ATP synthase
MLGLDITKLKREIQGWELCRTMGKVRGVRGLIQCSIPAAVGDQCEIVRSHQSRLPAEVIGFSDGIASLVPYEHATDLHPDMTVVRTGRGLMVPVGSGLLGRVVDGLARPLDGRGPLPASERRAVRNEAPPALDRARIRARFATGQRAIDGLLTFGRGQRVGIFAGSGVGKSMLLGEVAKSSDADVNVLALIGERGREVRPFLDDCLGPQGLERSVVVLATSDQTPLMRVRAAQVAITMAEHFREAGANVLFLLDSLTRLAMAQREMGLALGEPPSARGYTPSVFQLLATTTERLGYSARGSITGIMTVLVDGDDLDEPISDAVRSLVDGHIVLDRRLAERGHYPAVNISRSISRIAHDVTDRALQEAARKVRAILATHAEVEDLIRIGAYAKGTSPQVDKALELMPAVEAFLRQQIGERTTFEDTRAALERIGAAWPFS